MRTHEGKHRHPLAGWRARAEKRRKREFKYFPLAEKSCVKVKCLTLLRTYVRVYALRILRVYIRMCVRTYV